MSEATVENLTQQIGRELFVAARGWTSHDGEEGGLLDRMLMDLGMRDGRLKARLFQFVDVLPALRSERQIANLLRQYLEPVRDQLPWPGGFFIHHLDDNGVLATPV